MNIIKRIKLLRYELLIKVYSTKPLDNNKIIMWSNSFKSYGCNPKYIAEYLIKNYPGQFDIVWVIDETLSIPESIPASVRVVKYFSKEYLYELHTARFVICNARTSNSYFWHKRKKQVYIQTWHSSIRLKTIEKDAENYLPQSYIDAAKGDSRKIDYIISGCKFSTNIFKNSFWYDGEILECGTPRIDFLLNFNNKCELIKKIGISDECNYILYSPTFRNDNDFNYNFDFKTLIDACNKKFGGKWKILYRLHPNLIHKIKEYDLGEECINMCYYPDMQELIAVSDIMITDYSSCMFDMMYIKKPCILYMPDFNIYTSNERKLYFDIKELPFEKVYTQQELFSCIENFDKDIYENSINSFLTQIGSYETGDALKEISDLIIKEREKL